MRLKSAKSARTSVRFTPLDQAKLRQYAVNSDIDVATLVRKRLSDIVETGSFVCVVCRQQYSDAAFSQRKTKHPLLVCADCGAKLPQIITLSKLPEKWVEVLYCVADPMGLSRIDYDKGVALLTYDLRWHDPTVPLDSRTPYGVVWHRTLEAAVSDAYRMARQGVRILEAFQDAKTITLNVEVVVTCESGLRLPVVGSLLDP